MVNRNLINPWEETKKGNWWDLMRLKYAVYYKNMMRVKGNTIK